MPRRQKSKLRAREKCHQGQGQGAGQGVGSAEAAAAAAAAGAEGPPSSPTEGTPQGSPQVGAAQQPQGARVREAPGAGAASPPREQGAESLAAPPALGARNDPLARKANNLLQFLLEKHVSKEPITKPALLKVVSRKYKGHLPEILRRTSQRLELLFGLELKEGDTGGQCYALACKVGRPGDGGDKGPPTRGLVLALLGVIFMKGGRASEEDVWEFLNMLGVYAGHRHPILGEPRKLITQELVRQKLLEYRHVPASNPPRHEFLWGPRARADTSKMQALQVLAKLNDVAPSCFPQLYQEALRDEEARLSARVPARGASAGEAAAPSRAGGASRAGGPSGAGGASGAWVPRWRRT